MITHPRMHHRLLPQHASRPRPVILQLRLRARHLPLVAGAVRAGRFSALLVCGVGAALLDVGGGHGEAFVFGEFGGEAGGRGLFPTPIPQLTLTNNRAVLELPPLIFLIHDAVR